MKSPLLSALAASLFSLSFITFGFPSEIHAQPVNAQYSIRGIALAGSWGIENPGSADADASLQDLKNTGANWVEIVNIQYQSASTSVTFDTSVRKFSDTSIIHAITTAHRLGLKVLLKIHISSSDSTPSYSLTPSDVGTWFATYQNIMVSYAQVAQQNNVEMFSIGNELCSLDSASANHVYWSALIQAVRAVYSGPLTYAANANCVIDIPFWGELDYIGINAYTRFPLTSNPTVQYLIDQWTAVPNPAVYNLDSTDQYFARQFDYESPVQFFKDTSAKYGKPIIFTETGWSSVPNDYTYASGVYTSGTQDLQEQVNDYSAFFAVFGNRNDSWFAGAFFWNWEPTENPAQYSFYPTIFTPQGKPALAVITNWFTPLALPVLSATPVSDSQIDLSWTQGTYSTAGGYVLYRDNTRVASLSSATTAYSNIGLSAGTTYHYGISAVDSEGNLAKSNRISATTAGSSAPASSNTAQMSTYTGGSSVSLPPTETTPAVSSSKSDFSISKSKIFQLQALEKFVELFFLGLREKMLGPNTNN